MHSRQIAFIFTLLSVGFAVTNADDEYQCDADDCEYGENECMCARGGPPGGLSAEQTPQFIIITADNAVTSATDYAMRRITNWHMNSNGCNIPATWFTEVDYTDASLVRQLYLDGYEIATKTASHQASPSVSDIVDARDWVSTNANIPENAVNGFRSPYLKHDARTRSILYKYGFRFDSSIAEQYGTYGSATSQTSSDRLWPYTMDYGIPQYCRSTSGSCEEGEEYPGLWEVPMWVAQDIYDEPIAAMDPWSATESVYDIYIRELNRNYYGNRAPVGLFVHPGWLLTDSSNIQNINAFLWEALQFNDTYVVTINQMLDWMNNPMDVDTFREYFTSNVQCPEGGYVPAWTQPDVDGDAEIADADEEENDDEETDVTTKGGYYEDLTASEYAHLVEQMYATERRRRHTRGWLIGTFVAIVFALCICRMFLRDQDDFNSIFNEKLMEDQNVDRSEKVEGRSDIFV